MDAYLRTHARMTSRLPADAVFDRQIKCVRIGFSNRVFMSHGCRNLLGAMLGSECMSTPVVISPGSLRERPHIHRRSGISESTFRMSMRKMQIAAQRRFCRQYILPFCEHTCIPVFDFFRLRVFMSHGCRNLLSPMLGSACVSAALVLCTVVFACLSGFRLCNSNML